MLAGSEPQDSTFAPHPADLSAELDERRSASLCAIDPPDDALDLTDDALLSDDWEEVDDNDVMSDEDLDDHQAEDDAGLPEDVQGLIADLVEDLVRGQPRRPALRVTGRAQQRPPRRVAPLRRLVPGVSYRGVVRVVSSGHALLRVEEREAKMLMSGMLTHRVPDLRPYLRAGEALEVVPLRPLPGEPVTEVPYVRAARRVIPRDGVLYSGTLTQGRVLMVGKTRVVMVLPNGARSVLPLNEALWLWPREAKLWDLFPVGRTVPVMVLSAPDEFRYGVVSHRATLPDPWPYLFWCHPVGARVRAQVLWAHAGGLMVELTKGVKGAVFPDEVQRLAGPPPEPGDWVDVIIAEHLSPRHLIRLRLRLADAGAAAGADPAEGAEAAERD